MCCCCCCCCCGGSVGCPLSVSVCVDFSQENITSHKVVKSFIFFDFPFIRFISLCARRRRRLSLSLSSLSLLFSSVLLSPCSRLRRAFSLLLFLFLLICKREREREKVLSRRDSFPGWLQLLLLLLLCECECV